MGGCSIVCDKIQVEELRKQMITLSIEQFLNLKNQ